MARALLIDLDGVVRVWSPKPTELAEAVTGLPSGAIAEVAFAEETLRPAVTGRVTDGQWREAVVARLQARFPAADCARAVGMWSRSAGAADAEVLAIVRACRRAGPVILVTNATSRLPDDLRRLNIAGEFDAVINSSELGAAKPDERIYRAALWAARVPAEGAIFVDDLAVNVDAARRLGMTAHVYRGARLLRERLIEGGLLAPGGRDGDGGSGGA